MEMTQGDAYWADKYRKEMELARLQCHNSYLDDIDALLRFSCDAARGVKDVEASTGVPALLLEELQGESREVLRSNRDKVCEALADAHMYILERSRTKVESGQMAPRDSDQQKARCKETLETRNGKKTRISIKNVLKEGIQLHVNMVVDAWEARKNKCNQNCDSTGLQSLLDQAVELIFQIGFLNRDIGFSAEAMERFEKVLKCTTQGDIQHEVVQVLGGQLGRTEGTLENIQRRLTRSTQGDIQHEVVQVPCSQLGRIEETLENIQHRLQALEDVQEGTRKAVERDRPPRYFLLVPPLKLPIKERFFNKLNLCSQTFHMYFVCQAFLDDLKEMDPEEMKNEIPPGSMNTSPEFSKPLLVKQSAKFVENHKRAINVGLKVTNILLKVATNPVGMSDVIPDFNVKNHTRLLKKFAENLRAQIGEHDKDDNEYDYERLRTFLVEHHNTEWREAVAAKLKLVVQGEHHAHVCKENASHEGKWKKRRIHEEKRKRRIHSTSSA